MVEGGETTPSASGAMPVSRLALYSASSLARRRGSFSLDWQPNSGSRSSVRIRRLRAHRREDSTRAKAGPSRSRPLDATRWPRGSSELGRIWTVTSQDRDDRWGVASISTEQYRIDSALLPPGGRLQNASSGIAFAALRRTGGGS